MSSEIEGTPCTSSAGETGSTKTIVRKHSRNTWGQSTETFDITLSAKYSSMSIIKKFRILCGIETVILLIVAVVLAVGHFIIFASYSQHSPLQREGLWVFLFMGLLSSFQALFFIGQILVAVWFEKAVKVKESLKDETSHRTFLVHMRLLYDSWLDPWVDVNGKYYLVKMQISEVLENALQVLNMATVYVCNMSPPLTILLSLVLTLESICCLWTALKVRTPLGRDRQLLLDLFTDIFCTFFPLSYMRYANGANLTVDITLQITAIPTLFALSKASTIFVDVFEIDRKRIADPDFRAKGSQSSRRRISILRQGRLSEKWKQQLSKFPGRIRFLVAAGHLLFILCMLLWVYLQLVTQPSYKECSNYYSKEVWLGCSVPTPFCQDIFVPHCDCAIYDLRHHNMTVLPDVFVHMKSLQQISIQHGPLKALPSGMGALTGITFLNFDFNHLSSFDVDARGWDSLFVLSLNYNRIKDVHHTVWKHKSLSRVSISYNPSLQFPESQLNLKNLRTLDLDGSNVSFSAGFSSQRCPILEELYISGSYISRFPVGFLGVKNTLLQLGIGRCNLTTIPPWFSQFRYLKFFDIRNNFVDNVDPSFKAMLSENNAIAYFAGNPVCESDSQLDCVPLCSMYCYHREELGNRVCNQGCNTKKCEFDGGDCDNINQIRHEQGGYWGYKT